MKPFVVLEEIRFRHCDAAAIVFYPRYFEMINDTVESWFGDVLGIPFSKMHDEQYHMGVPTKSITCEFLYPSRLGDWLVKELTVSKIGSTSCNLHIRFTGKDDHIPRINCHNTIVCIDLQTMRPAPWSDSIRKIMQDYLQEPKAS